MSDYCSQKRIDDPSQLTDEDYAEAYEYYLKMKNKMSKDDKGFHASKTAQKKRKRLMNHKLIKDTVFNSMRQFLEDERNFKYVRPYHDFMDIEEPHRETIQMWTDMNESDLKIDFLYTNKADKPSERFTNCETDEELVKEIVAFIKEQVNYHTTHDTDARASYEWNFRDDFYDADYDRLEYAVTMKNGETFFKIIERVGRDPDEDYKSSPNPEPSEYDQPAEFVGDVWGDDE